MAIKDKLREFFKNRLTLNLKNYECYWCGHKFKLPVSSSGEGHRKVSSQIQRPECNNFIPTWKGKK